MEHGVRKVDVAGEGPGLGPRDRHPLAPERRHRGHRHQGRHPRAPQRLPPAQAAAGLRPRWLATPVPRSRSRRRLGVNIFENAKGAQGPRAAPVPAGRARPHPPPRSRRSTSLQLQEKQKARRIYGLLEKQFREPLRGGQPPAGRHRREPAAACSSCASTTSCSAPAGPRTRPQARQFVSHGHVDVNGRRVDIPSYRVRKGDVVTPARQGQAMIVIQPQPRHARPPAPRRGSRPARAAARSPSASCPLREQIDVPVREQLIVELYSK